MEELVLHLLYVDLQPYSKVGKGVTKKCFPLQRLQAAAQVWMDYRRIDLPLFSPLLSLILGGHVAHLGVSHCRGPRDPPKSQSKRRRMDCKDLYMAKAMFWT